MEELIKKWEKDLAIKQDNKRHTTYKQQRAFISGQIGIIKEAIKDLKEYQKIQEQILTHIKEEKESPF